MSIQVMTAVWRDSRNRGSALLLLLALADFAHDDGTGVHPSVKTMAAKSRQSERNTQYLLRHLEASGELQPDGIGPHGTTRYRIVVDAKLQGCKDCGVQSSVENDTEGRNLAPKKAKIVRGVAPDPSAENRHIQKTVIGRATRFPKDFSLTEDMKKYATQHRVDPNREWLEFWQYWSTSPKRHFRWDLVWQRWVRSAVERGRTIKPIPLNQVPFKAPSRPDPEIIKQNQKIVDDIMAEVFGD